MAEPFDTLAAQQVEIIRALAAVQITPEDAASDVSEIYETLSLNSGTLEAVKATLGRVRGMFVVSAPPSDFLGTPGSTAFDPTNRLWYGPKDAVTGWPAGVAFIDQGPAGVISSVTTEIIAPGEDVEVVAGGTPEARTLLFRLPDLTTLTGTLIDLLGRADLYEMDRTYDATQFLSRGRERLFGEGYYRTGTEVEADFTDLTGVSFTRSTVGYGLKINGTYESFGITEPRVTDKGITVEPAATNLFPRFAPTTAQLPSKGNCSDAAEPSSPPITAFNG